MSGGRTARWDVTGNTSPATPAADLRLTCHRAGRSTLVVALSGELDALAVQATQPAILRLLTAEPVCRVILDLAGVRLLAAVGVEMLIALRRTARTVGFRLILTGAGHRAVALPLQITGALPLFETRPSVNSALR